MAPLTERQQLDNRLAELKSVRKTFEKDWKAQIDELLPYRARWYRDRMNKSEPKDSKRINSTPMRALRIYAAGMMAGITSPSREWFQLTTSDTKLNENSNVSRYLDTVARIIRATFLRSRWYQSLASGVYRDLGSIANAAMFAMEHPVYGLWFEPQTVGEYFWDVDDIGKVDTFFSVRPWSARQIIQRFGEDNASDGVKQAYRAGKVETFDVVHAIIPNEEWQPSKADRNGMKWASRWYELNTSNIKMLRVGGYHEFPMLCPRLNAVAGETYGRGGPGWESKGDAKAVQHCEKELALLYSKSSKPPMKASAAIKQERASLVAGDVTYMPDGAGHVFAPAMEVTGSQIAAAKDDIARHEERINKSFLVDIWQAIIDDTRNQRPTATEVEARERDRLLQLGPTLESLNNELLEPAIERSYHVLNRQGRLPDPPDEIMGADIRIEFVSIMHQAQKLTSISGIRELIVQASTMAQIGRTDALDKLAVDKIMDELQDILGVKPELVLSEDEVDKVRQVKAEQEQQQQQQEQLMAATQGARNLSGVDVRQTATDVASAISPAAAAQGGLQ